MKGDDPGMDPELRALLEIAKTPPGLPDAVRARALERARRTLIAPGRDTEMPLHISVSAVRWPWVRVASAATAFFALAAAGALAAYRSRELKQPAFSRARSTPIPLVGVTTARGLPAPAPAIVPDLVTRTQRPARPGAGRAPYAAELRLLQRAQAAYATGDFGTALMLVAEHRRRFPNGRLAEEREALRVRSLADAGRTREARRSMVEFGTRFPRSVLLSRLQAKVQQATQ